MKDTFHREWVAETPGMKQSLALIKTLTETDEFQSLKRQEDNKSIKYKDICFQGKFGYILLSIALQVSVK